MKIVDPIQFAKLCWPKVTFYRQQQEMIYSVRDNNETFVVAGNMLGKDYVAAFIVLWFFMSRHPCRIVTTSTKDKHLDVLWGEIGRFVRESRYPLDSRRGGLLIVKHHEINKMVDGQRCPLSYVIGLVANDQTAESFQGHHVAQTGDGVSRTMFVGDEASSLPDSYYTMADTWANRKLIFGNPWPCENFFKHAVKGKPGTKDHGGDIPDPNNNHFYRKIIQVKAIDSPNVRYGIARKKAGKSSKILIPGVKPYHEYLKNRRLWDAVRQCVCLDAEFYEGAETLLYPPDWLNRAEQIAARLVAKRRGEAMGVDPAEGGDSSAWAIIDHRGLIELLAKKTADTTEVTNQTLALANQFQIPDERIFFDRGGGGKQHVDRLRLQGRKVKTVAFGESVMPQRRRGITPMEQRIGHDEVKYAYRNRRAQMYGILRELLDPTQVGFGLPARYPELRRQLAVMPLRWDGEGRMVMLPKHKRNKDDKRETLTELVGHSPDEADALVLAVYGLQYEKLRPKAGVTF